MLKTLQLISRCHYAQQRRELQVSLEILNKFSKEWIYCRFRGIEIADEMACIHWDAYILVMKKGIKLQDWVVELLFEAAEPFTKSRYPIEASNYENFQNWLLSLL